MIKSRNILFIALIFMIMNCSETDELKIVTNDRGERVALGEVTPDQIIENFADYKRDYQNYVVDTLALGSLNIPPGNVEILILMATWCSDCQREVPRFFKVMDQLKNKNIKTKYICVDRSKKDENGIAESHEVEFIPTFIIKFNNEEIGRIVETAQISIEEDLIEIFTTAAL